MAIAAPRCRLSPRPATREPPRRAARVTLLPGCRDPPSSGILPGFVAGLYAREEPHTDLARRAPGPGPRLIHAEAIGIDRGAKRVLLAGRPPVAYDILSIDVGITPDLASIPGAAEHGIAVKPIGTCLARLEHLRVRCSTGQVRHITVIGDG